MKAVSATDAWLKQVERIVIDGERCGNTIELLSSSLCFDMNKPIVGNKGRKINYGFMFAEALYIVTGQSSVVHLQHHIKKFGDYADLYPFQQGSYGPPFVEQVRYVVETLRDNAESRQAVMTIWRPNPRKSKDVPCTIALQFLVRDGQLHLIVTMRSSDAFTGLIYDMFCFSAMAAVVRSYMPMDIPLGTCWINAGSSHLYDKDRERVKHLNYEDDFFEPYEWGADYLAIINDLNFNAEHEHAKRHTGLDAK